MKKNNFPAGWDEERARRVLAHYEGQTEDEAVAEDEQAFADQTQTVMEIPTELVPAVRELLAKHRSA
jgi:type II secretory pathway component PulC